MTPHARNRLLLLGALWGLALAAVPAALAFDRFSLSPFLISAFLCAALSGAAGALVAGRRAAGSRPGGWSILGAGALQGLVTALLAALSIWVALTATMAGFSTASPLEVLDLLTEPGIFMQSAVAAIAVFTYYAAVGLLLSPLIGTVIVRVVRAREPRPASGSP